MKCSMCFNEVSNGNPIVNHKQHGDEYKDNISGWICNDCMSKASFDPIKLPSILLEAESLVNGERAKQYGDSVENWKDIAKIASAIIGKELTPKECLWVLVATKLAREKHAHKRDNLSDGCGYLELINRQEERK